MKQVLQDLKTGATHVIDAPVPRPLPGHVVIMTAASLVSAGTERALVDFGKAGWIGKAIQQPEKVLQLAEKIRTDGIAATIAAVRNKFEQGIAPGYSNAGLVVEVGEGVAGFRPGDRVVSNGKHAEYVSVPVNLCAKVPDEVRDDAAAFTVLGAIALQGIRLAQPMLGERFAVIGLGLIGLLSVQILRAHGCQVLAMDLQSDRLRLASQFGASVVDLAAGADPLAAAQQFTARRGIDGVIIAASTSSSQPVSQAAKMCRKRGRIVLVGVTGLELSRSDFYEKELTFQVSCSYGPGRYDPAYEEKGHDYPFGFVRWTEQRNFEAVLDLLAQGRLDVAPLITHRFPVSEAGRAYALLAGSEPHLGVLFEYPREGRDQSATLSAAAAPRAAMQAAGGVVAGVIGAGNYASMVVLPALARTNARRKLIVSANGLSGAYQGRRHGFEASGADTQALFADEEINAVLIVTRHDTHADLVVRGLDAGKHVFVEKPLALREEELNAVAMALARNSGRLLMVGFNRRFAPHALKMRERLAAMPEPMSIVITVNAGTVPAGHWTQDGDAGGGRIVGEACHFIDLARFIAGHRIADVEAVGVREQGVAYSDKASITLRFTDGSFAVIHYLANGHRSFPKERVEVFCGGRILQLDNFRRLNAYGWPGFGGMRLWRQDKGNAACIAAFIKAVDSGGPAPIPADELFEVSKATLQAAEMLRC